MTGTGARRPDDLGEWRRQVLTAAGIVGLWEWDHRRGTARYCSTAAKLLAGDTSLAWHDLAPTEAFAGVHAEDAPLLREQMKRAVSMPDMRIREYQVSSEQAGTRRVLCRGRTCHDEDGRPIQTMGIVIDITDFEGDGRIRFVDDDDKLDSAAKHGIAAYEAIEATGLTNLLHPARALLIAIGREIARGISKGFTTVH